MLSPSVAREVNRLADELVRLIAASDQPDKPLILSALFAAVSQKVDQSSPISSPGDGVGDPMRAKVPVPAQIVEQAQRQFNEEEVVTGLREIRESGGLSLNDFYHELEKLTEPRE
jgi:hypothetical protein